MSSPLCVLSQNENLSVSFCGSGFLATYQLGAAQSLLDNAAWILQGAPRVYGASAGSLVAAAVVCGSNLGRVRDQLLEFARFTKQHPLGLLSPTVDIFRWLEVTLQRCLPDNAHTLASGRLHISMTRISDGKNVIVSEYNSSDELIKALLCSCFVPVYSGVIPPQYKGEHYMDGGFTNIQPFEDSSPTLTISPFAGHMDICLSDTSTILCDAIIQQLSFQCSVTNFIRLVDALFPRDWRILKRAFYSGYQDTVYFLQQSNALPLYPQRRKESDASDDSVSSDHWMLTQTDRAEEEESHQNCPEQPAVNGVCSSVSPSRQEPTVHKSSPVEVQEVLLCNIVGQLEIVSNSNAALLQRTLSYLLLLFTLPIWSATTLWDRYQKWLTNAMTVAYWLWHGIKLFMIFILKIVLSSTRKAFGDMMLSLISFIPAQVHDEQHRRRELSERHMTSSNLNGHVSAVFPPSPSMAQTLPKLYTLLFSLETESKWRRRKIEVQHTLQQHVAGVKRN
ncbi:patatin-like phospholipase domain-containing protein 3 [Sinocyclocheilus anshuiensis]|uniref:patatin-like phospholipase domain-containing protein 3 n=1 Tax=Sinocyclocheilus anshuiensis TaxID=1608454 RepID=UPI0007B8FAC6|nr:PREDICTED: patatin-like phospholipase domain-containing protein 3 [Sinocyclocheilus anshuiensis]